MKRWPIKPLGELCDVRIGRTPRRDQPRFWGGDAVWVTVGELNGGEITSSKENISNAAVRECMPKPVPAGTLLFSFKLSIGKMAMAGCPLYTNEAIAALPIRNPTELSRDFLRYALMAESREGTADTAVLGKLLNKEKVRQLLIPVPPLAEQQQIVKLLDEADHLRKLGAQADRRTAALIPALFHEIFGDLMKNSKGWDVKKLGEVASHDRYAIRMGPFGSQLKKHELVCDGIKVLWIENVVSGNFEWKGNKCITRDKYEQLKGFSVKPSDVLITTMGTIGRCCVVPDTIGTAIISSHLIKITLNLAIVNPIFISEIVKSEYAASFYSSFAHGAIMKGLNTTIVKSLPIPIPPLALQKQFAMRVAEIRELEAEQTASHRRLDALFQSLLHRAFQGDL
jgi:type I restriction enzyme S subunit